MSVCQVAGSQVPPLHHCISDRKEEERREGMGVGYSGESSGTLELQDYLRLGFGLGLELGL